MSIYRAQIGIYLKHEHTVPRDIQKSTFKSKTHLNIKKKKKIDKRNQEQSSPLEFPSVFRVVFNSALHRPAQQIFTHHSDIDRTKSSLHFGGRGAGVRVCWMTPHVKTLRFSPPKTAVCVLYILLFY